MRSSAHLYLLDVPPCLRSLMLKIGRFQWSPFRVGNFSVKSVGRGRVRQGVLVVWLTLAVLEMTVTVATTSLSPSRSRDQISNDLNVN